MLKLFLGLLLTLLALGCQPSSPTADLILRNATVYTVDEDNPRAQSLAVVGDTIAFVGSDADVQAWVGEATEVLDMRGKTVTPGFIEGHAHFSGVGANQMNLDLMVTRSYDEIIRQVKRAVRDTPPGEWIIGRGWHQDKWDSLPATMVQGFPVHEALSAASPNNPVYLRHASGHAALANAKAMEVAGVMNIDQEGMQVRDVEGGEVFRDNLGNPTGLFNENAMGLITRHIPEDTPERRRRVAELAMQACLENGITSFHDAGAPQEEITLYKQLAEEGALKTRLYVMLSGRDTSLLQQYWQSGPEVGLGNHFLTLRCVKLYGDGALGSRGAWLLNEYEDMPDAYGHETTSMSRVYEVSVKALQAGFQVGTHAIGDRANREVLDQYAAAFVEYPAEAKDARFRIEHAQHISAADIPRFGQMGVIPAMQAIHMASDRPWAIDRLGKDRIEEGAYVWRKLLDSGAIIVNGTDAPVEPLNPLPSFYASVARKTLKGEPEGGYEPGQKMTREEALKSYTLFPAYAAFEENIKGSIEVGKLADFTVFSKDIMTVPEDEILSTKVDYTIVGGKVLYARD